MEPTSASNPVNAGAAVQPPVLEGRQSFIGKLYFHLYRRAPGSLRTAMIRHLLKIEGGDMLSLTVRRIFLAYHNLSVGMYSDCETYILANIAPGTSIGRYSSIANTARILGKSPAPDQISTYGALSSTVPNEDTPETSGVKIGHDVWLGHNAVILPSVRSIGDGAVIGTGAVVHNDIPPYATAVGSPARVVRYRFSEKTITGLLASRWWDGSIAELGKDLPRFQTPLEGESVR